MRTRNDNHSYFSDTCVCCVVCRRDQLLRTVVVVVGVVVVVTLALLELEAATHNSAGARIGRGPVVIRVKCMLNPQT